VHIKRGTGSAARPSPFVLRITLGLTAVLEHAFVAATRGRGQEPEPDARAAVTDFGDLQRIADTVGGFPCILADPAIRFTTWSRKGEGRTPQHHYRCGPFAEIVALPVATIAALDAFLFLWWPLPSVYLVKPLMEAWGFQFSGSAFAWAKTNKASPGWAMGCGYSTRHNVEICWLGQRGKPTRLSKGVRELIVAPRRQHSRKPDEQYERIEQLCSGPRVELFARQRWPDWHAHGDQVQRFGVAP
jgi:N6-adenosine-specific RNA methylase IME4